MKKLRIMVLLSFVILSLGFMSCDGTENADEQMTKQNEQILQESNRQLGMPAIVNYQEKKNLKWIYELCDQEEFICYAYLYNAMTGEVGQYLGECIGYGIPYSTQYSNPQKVDSWYNSAEGVYTIPQAEPNGLFKAEGMSATWLIMIDPNTKEPRPVYVEPDIIVSPFKLK